MKTQVPLAGDVVSHELRHGFRAPGIFEQTRSDALVVDHAQPVHLRQAGTRKMPHVVKEGREYRFFRSVRLPGGRSALKRVR